MRVELEALEAGDVAASIETLAAAWSAWVASGPQGPINEDDETDFPDATG